MYLEKTIPLKSLIFNDLKISPFLNLVKFKVWIVMCNYGSGKKYHQGNFMYFIFYPSSCLIMGTRITIRINYTFYSLKVLFKSLDTLYVSITRSYHKLNLNLRKQSCVRKCLIRGVQFMFRFKLICYLVPNNFTGLFILRTTLGNKNPNHGTLWISSKKKRLNFE